MRCMVGEVDLLLAERHGIAIDYCPECEVSGLTGANLTKASNEREEFNENEK
jgi:Zn-finger nucleic acid-binding protein